MFFIINNIKIPIKYDQVNNVKYKLKNYDLFIENNNKKYELYPLLKREKITLYGNKKDKQNVIKQLISQKTIQFITRGNIVLNDVDFDGKKLYINYLKLTINYKIICDDLGDEKDLDIDKYLNDKYFKPKFISQPDEIVKIDVKTDIDYLCIYCDFSEDLEKINNKYICSYCRDYCCRKCGFNDKDFDLKWCEKCEKWISTRCKCMALCWCQDIGCYCKQCYIINNYEHKCEKCNTIITVNKDSKIIIEDDKILCEKCL